MSEPLLQEIIDRDLARVANAERVDLPAQHFAMYVNMVNDVLKGCIKQERFFNKQQAMSELRRTYDLPYCVGASNSYRDILSLIEGNSDFDIFPSLYTNDTIVEATEM